MTSEMREALAAYAHEAWSGWMRHMFKLSQEDGKGAMIVPAGLVARWKRQAFTEYDALPELEKDSDRKEAIRMMVIMQRTKGD